MTTPAAARIQRITLDFRRRLAAHDATAAKTLERAYHATLTAVQQRLATLYKSIGDKQRAGEPVPISWLYEEHRLENAKAFIQAQIDHFAGFARGVTAQQQHEAAMMGTTAARVLLDATIPQGVAWTFGRPSPGAIANLVAASQPGSPLYDLFGRFGADAASQAAQALITGITLGRGPREVAKGVADALDITRSRALTIARTEQLRAYRGAQLENFRANDDVVEGWIWMANLGHACAACTAMNGTKHSLDESMDSHPNCACTQAPQTKSWDAILSPLGIDTSDIEETRIDVPSGAAWFDEQDQAVQRDILGSQAAYDLWKNNDDVELKDFVGWNESDDWGRSLYQRSAKQIMKSRR